ncbi:MAG TPA: hypothetical protein VNX68_00385 [Nitrosopumilaceae archaeon]|jgi:hypothetical protein|nr:hypothetical protein [Nitrosopumilaceae archaeon]
MDIQINFFKVDITIVLRDTYFKERGLKSESHKIVPYQIAQSHPFIEQDEHILLECIFLVLNDSAHARFDESWKERNLTVGDIIIFPNGHMWECQDCGWGMIDKW